MLPRSWMEVYLRFLPAYRWPVLTAALLLSVFLGYHLSHTVVQMNFFDLNPPQHPDMQLMRKHPRMFGSANVLVVGINQAIEEALMTTGRAILFTGATLTASMIFWLFFPMKFQVEMAFLLTLILFLHVVGALVFIPSMVSLFKPRFATPGGRPASA